MLAMTPSPASFERQPRIVSIKQLGRTAVANQGRRRSARLPTRFTHCAVAAHVAVPQARMHRRWSRDGGGLRRSDYSRRDTRQSAKRRGSAPIGGGRESPLTHPAPRCRHDSSRTRGSSQPPPAAAAPARTRRFAAASNRSDRPAIAVASTAIGVAGRNYIDLENALFPLETRLRDSGYRCTHSLRPQVRAANSNAVLP